MRTVPRTRHYVSPGALTLCRPLLCFDYAREAYVLRGIGDRIGPVLRENRRRVPESGDYSGPERRRHGARPRPGDARAAASTSQGGRRSARRTKPARDRAASSGSARDGAASSGAARDRVGGSAARPAGSAKARAAHGRRSRVARTAKRPRG